MYGSRCSLEKLVGITIMRCDVATFVTMMTLQQQQQNNTLHMKASLPLHNVKSSALKIERCKHEKKILESIVKL